jgi:DEAD/DEAH box helicase domain-containing protein
MVSAKAPATAGAVLEATQKKTKRKRSSSSPQNGDSPQPAALAIAGSTDPAPVAALIRLHKSLATIYTLLSTRPHVTITFDKLAPTVTAQLGRPLEHMDVARLKAILGGDELVFEYARMEDIDAMNAKKKKEMAGFEQSLAPDEENGDEEILLVEFRDAKLRQTPSAKGSSNSMSVRMPTVRKQDMVKAIERRVARFRTALTQFIEAHGGLIGPDLGVRRCWEDRLDVEATRLLPVSAKETRPLDPVQAMLIKSEQEAAVANASGAAGGSENFNFTGYIDALKRDPAYQNQIVPGGEFTVPEQAAVYAENTTELLGDALQDALDRLLLADTDLDRGSHVRLYAHQADALKAVFEGLDVVVSTSTSSGKSLIYQLPILKMLWQWHNAKSNCRSTKGDDDTAEPPCPTAIFIFPTKALAQDQMRSFNHLKSLLFPANVAESFISTTYDGDTSADDRARNSGRYTVIFTNPDMLHVNVLPNWERPAWHSFLAGLKYVVLDELHMYQAGSFGLHVSLVLRRLRRIVDHCAGPSSHKAGGCMQQPSFQAISCSATISHPALLMQSVFGVSAERVRMVANDGSPAGAKHWLVWNSPYITPATPESGRVHPIQEATRMLADLTMAGVRTIAFCRYRRTCELLMKSVTAEFDRRYQKINAKRRRMASGDKDNDAEERREPPNVMAYRGGYSASDRRLIEHELFAGRLAGVVATNALELGIDIGALDAVLMVGFPMTVASLRQQAGRAGRRARASLAILIGGGDPLDQHYMANPRLAVEDNEPAARTSADVAAEMAGLGDNEGVFEEHLQCAAFEIPINIEADQSYFTSALSKEKGYHDLTVFQSIVEKKLDCVNDIDVDGAATELGDRYYTCDAKWLPMPARQVALRGSGGQLGTDENYSVIDIDSHIVLEEIEPARVSFTLYEGGVFIHQGCTYLVKSVEPDARYALVARRDGLSWITRQRDYTDIDPAKTLSVSSHGKLLQAGSQSSAPLLAVAKYGLVAVATVVFGFFKLTTTTADGTGAYSKVIDAVELPESQMRPYKRTCAGLWVDFPLWLQELVAHDKGLSLAGAIHAAEHAVLNALSGNSNSDTTGQAAPRLATECKAPEKEFKREPSARRRPARLIFYDPEVLDLAGGHEHRRNTAWRAYTGLGSALARALSRMEHCPCTIGCPECGVTWGPCTENNVVVSKPGALVLLRYLNSPLAAHNPPSAAPGSMAEEELADLRKALVLGVPDGPEENLAGHPIAQTII